MIGYLPKILPNGIQPIQSIHKTNSSKSTLDNSKNKNENHESFKQLFDHYSHK